MQTVVMTQATLSRQNNNGTIKCKFCGEPINEGELCVKRKQSSTGYFRIIYAHKQCEDDHRVG